MQRQHETEDPSDVLATLAGGGVHVVCFADLEAASTRMLLGSGAGLDDEECRLFCEGVNTADTTGCLWPIAKLSALPARFARTPIASPDEIRRCLERVLELNATLCKCPVLILDVRAAPGTCREIESQARDLLAACAGTSFVQELKIVRSGDA